MSSSGTPSSERTSWRSGSPAARLRLRPKIQPSRRVRANTERRRRVPASACIGLGRPASRQARCRISASEKPSRSIT